MSRPESHFLLRVPDEVASELRRMHPAIKCRIRGGLRAILENPHNGKPLKYELQGLRSYRIKQYRIIYRINPEQRHLEIVAIGPRKNIYEETYRLLKEENQ